MRNRIRVAGSVLGVLMLACGGAEEPAVDPASVPAVTAEEACAGEGQVSLGASHDAFLQDETADIIAFWDAPVEEVYFINDANTPGGNAYACHNGNIAFGWTLYSHHLEEHGELGIISVLSHEVAHQVQRGDGIERAPPMHELEADALAAYQLRYDRQIRTEDVNLTYTHVGTLGSSASATHGTRDQRVHATYVGFLLADQDRAAGQQRSIRALREAIYDALTAGST